MYDTETPRIKMNRSGAESLSEIELLQVMVGCGTQSEDYKQIAKSLYVITQKVGIDRLTTSDVKKAKGIGEAKAATFIAAIEYFRRAFTKQDTPLVDSPEKAAEQFEFIKSKKQEYFVLLTLDGARHLIKRRIITIGTLMTSLVHPREVFAPAIEDRAASIIIGHNHPSGRLDISEEDREVTRRIKSAGEVLGIKLDDHLVVAESYSGYGYVSVF